MPVSPAALAIMSVHIPEHWPKHMGIAYVCAGQDIGLDMAVGERRRGLMIERGRYLSLCAGEERNNKGVCLFRDILQSQRATAQQKNG